MRISIKTETKDYSITVEPSCFTVAEHGFTKEGSPKETLLGFFSNISKAVKRIVQEGMCEKDEIITLGEYCERIENAYRELIKQTDQPDGTQ